MKFSLLLLLALLAPAVPQEEAGCGLGQNLERCGPRLGGGLGPCAAGDTDCSNGPDPGAGPGQGPGPCAGDPNNCLNNPGTGTGPGPCLAGDPNCSNPAAGERPCGAGLRGFLRNWRCGNCADGEECPPLRNRFGFQGRNGGD